MNANAALRVLIVDDDEDIRDLVATYLGSQGLAVFEAFSEAGMREVIAAQSPEVILLDVNLGNEDGFAIARRLRVDWFGGLLMVTGRGDTIDRVVGLEIGADDYITKPFELRELLARIRSVGRRATAPSPAPVTENVATPLAVESPARVFRFESLTLDVERRELRLNATTGSVIALTTGEFDLLNVLVSEAGRVLSRDQLLQRTHHRDAGPFDRTIDVQIGRLRKKIGDNGKEPRIIKSVRGAGYLFAVPVQREGSR